MDSADYSTWLEIDLDAIRNNVRLLHKLSGRPVMAVVKANGYGHGLVEVATAAQSAGAAWCGVSRVEEAQVLRAAGIHLPILVLGYTSPQMIAEAIAGRFTLTLYDPDLVLAYAQQAAALGKQLNVHLKVDTGMGRLGALPSEALEFVRLACRQPSLRVEGVFTHFARADEPGPTTTNQLAVFEDVLQSITAAGLRPPMVHAANSAGTLYHPAGRYDLVRTGIAMYGLDPDYPNAVLPEGFIPALSWKARLTSVKRLPAQHGVGYGHTYYTKVEERIGVVPVGYADGFRRNAKNEVLIGGQRLPIIPRVCMDQSMLNLDTVPQAKAGDEVVLIGTQGSASLRAEEIGVNWHTNDYEVVCGLAHRLPRIYLNR